MKNILFALILAVFFVGVSLVIRIFFADVSFARGYANKNREVDLSVLLDFREAIRLNPLEPAYHRELATALTAETIEVLSAQEMPETASRAAELAYLAREEAAAAYRLNPYNSLTLKSIFRTYSSLARYFPSFGELAEAVGRQLLFLAPTEPRSYYSLANYYAREGNEEEAVKLVKMALALKPDFNEAESLRKILEKD